VLRLGTTRWRPHCEVYALAVSPDGKTLAVGAHWEISLWDLATGKQLRRFHERCCYPDALPAPHDNTPLLPPASLPPAPCPAGS
jgi:hypothetical protein